MMKMKQNIEIIVEKILMEEIKAIISNRIQLEIQEKIYLIN